MCAIVQTVRYGNKQKNKLYVCNIPRAMGRAQLLAAFRKLLVGVVDLDVTMQKDQGKPDENRGFCFVELYNTSAAELALDVLGKDVDFDGECASVSFPLPSSRWTCWARALTLTARAPPVSHVCRAIQHVCRTNSGRARQGRRRSMDGC